MSIDFTKAECRTYSDKKLFGLIDLPPAQISETDGGNWIAVVVNEYRYDVTFTAIDHCIVIKRPDGKDDSRCDGFLTYESTVVFVELKDRDEKGSKWIKEGDEQLRTSIGYFLNTDYSEQFDKTKRKAYIANKAIPKFRDGQQKRMDKFLDDTGFVLRIEKRIILD